MTTPTDVDLQPAVAGELLALAELLDTALHATDIEWTFDSGAPLSGAAEDLAFLVCGRNLPPGRIHGASLDD